MLNWIVWNRIDYLYKKMDLALNKLQRLICHKIPPTNQPTKNLIIAIILIIREFFTLALTGSFPLESEWQQASTSLQDSSQYSRRFQQYCSLNGRHSSSNF